MTTVTATTTCQATILTRLSSPKTSAQAVNLNHCRGFAGAARRLRD